VLLPGLTKVLALGGNRTDPLPPTSWRGAPTNGAEILDLSQPTPAWRSVAPMLVARQFPNAVLLPDGSVLAVGGGQLGEYEKPVRLAERFDPSTETWTAMAVEHTPRCYHSTALLLPDGRVLSAGMDHGKFARTGEVYSPPYLFAGPRPTIAAVPTEVAYGQAFTIATPEAANVARVALLRPGSVTHAFDFEQRYVALSFSADASGGLTAHMPTSHAEAPPGWYMLFLVTEGGVPSRAAFVHLG
jgi:galactose oxidase-like protein